MATDILDPEIDERISRLNMALHEAAVWVEARAEQTRAAYFAGGGVDARFDDSPPEECWDDFELDAIIKCSLTSDDAAFSPNNEYGNVVAVCETSMSLDYSKIKPDDFQLNWSTPYSERCRQSEPANPCYLFHEVSEHALDDDRDALARIGEIEINLALRRQRHITLPTALAPRNLTIPRSVFSSKYDYGHKISHLTGQERDYIRLLNQKMQEASTWITEQARLSEKDYTDMGGVDRQFTQDNAYEDYEMFMRVDGVIGQEHPEFDEDDDGIVISYSAPIFKENQRICGRGRNPLHFDRFGSYFPHRNRFLYLKNLWNVHQQRFLHDRLPYSCSESNVVYTCELFWNILKEAQNDWYKMLSIHQLWLETVFIQRRIAQLY